MVSARWLQQPPAWSTLMQSFARAGPPDIPMARRSAAGLCRRPHDGLMLRLVDDFLAVAPAPPPLRALLAALAAPSNPYGGELHVAKVELCPAPRNKVLRGVRE